MKANELRIGNLVQDEFGRTEEIWALERYKVQLCSGAMYVKSIKELSAIPLTEEWLLKFGFKKDYNGYRLKDLYSLSFSEKLIPCLNDRVLVSKELVYVHQLQNLYFALTGQELTQQTEK